MSTQKKSSVTTLCECAVMVALSFILSCMRLFPMPLGGSVTFASMLPVMLISVKYGVKVGIPTAFVYSLTQLAQALAEGDVFPYCEGAPALVTCVIFDYLFPFTALGIAGIFLKKIKPFKQSELNVYLGIFCAIFLRFVGHFITGAVIWGQWAPDGMGKYLYSFLYNGAYLGADFLICIVVAVLMFRKNELRRLVNLV